MMADVSSTTNSNICFELDRPKILAFCSVTGGCERDFGDLKNLPYFHSQSWEAISPESPLNLNLGFESYQPKVWGEKLISDWYRNNPEQLSTRIDKAENFVFVTFRGALQTVMKVPYEKTESWTMYAVKYRNHIFIYEVRKERPCPPLVEYRGFKLEQCLCSDHPHETPITSLPVHNQKEFCLVLHQRLNGDDVIYGGEFDALKRAEPLDTTEDVLEILNNDQDTKFIEIKSGPQKLLKRLDPGRSLSWFVQSFLSGIEEIYFAGKDDSGNVEKKKILETKNLPFKQPWSKDKCLQSLSDFFFLLKTTLREKQDFTKIKIDWQPGFGKPLCVETPWEPELDESKNIFDVLDLCFQRQTPQSKRNDPPNMPVRQDHNTGSRNTFKAAKRNSGYKHSGYVINRGVKSENFNYKSQTRYRNHPYKYI